MKHTILRAFFLSASAGLVFAFAHGFSPGQLAVSRARLTGGRAANAASSTVTGGGSTGKFAKWLGSSSIGDSGILEDKNGNVGIATSAPTSRLTVNGSVESSAGGFRFPDGTVQATSAAGALTSVTHDGTLSGAGSPASPLSVSS